MTNLIDTKKSLVARNADGIYTYSELFYSIQGEGAYTGRNTLWIRFFGCNLQCSGFGQVHPTKPETWVLPYKDYDATQVNRVEDLPVFEHGCDTPYSWSAKFKHLMHHATAEQIYERLVARITNDHNIFGKFQPSDGRKIDLCFTGGEPLMAHNQLAIIDIVDTMIADGNFPQRLSVETNGTQILLPEMYAKIQEWRREHGITFFFSCSPKMWSTAGERPEKALKPDVVASYWAASKEGQLKIVCNGSEESWGELEYYVGLLYGHKYNVEYPVYVMKVGATVEGQAGQLPGHDVTEAKFVEEVLRRGYHYSGRIHVGIWGNVVGS